MAGQARWEGYVSPLEPATFALARRLLLPSWPVCLLVDPRHDGGSQGSMERYAFRLGAFFEMAPNSGREANRARDGRAGFAVLPRPAPTGVERDPLRRDSKGVRIG